MEKLKDKVAVVTGGTRGLGLAIANAYGYEGAKVVIGSRSSDSVQNAVSKLKANGIEAGGLKCDVGYLEQVEALSLFALDHFGKIDVWVNNAGISAPYGPTIHIPSQEVERTLQTNILGVYYGSLVALRGFLLQGRGKLINVLGRGDKHPVPLQNAYASSKTWVRNFTLALAEEYKDSGVGVFAFKPGLVDTDMMRKVNVVSGYEQRIKGLTTVMRMWGKSPEVPAQKAVWIASDETDGKTGLVISVFNRKTMLAGILNELWNRMRRKPYSPLELEIITIYPSKEGIYQD